MRLGRNPEIVCPAILNRSRPGVPGRAEGEGCCVSMRAPPSSREPERSPPSAKLVLRFEKGSKTWPRAVHRYHPVRERASSSYALLADQVFRQHGTVLMATRGSSPQESTLGLVERPSLPVICRQAEVSQREKETCSLPSLRLPVPVCQASSGCLPLLEAARRGRFPHLWS